MRFGDVSVWIQLAGTLPLFLLAVLVLAAKPGSRASRALGGFLFAFGAVFLVRNVSLLLGIEDTTAVIVLNVIARLATGALVLTLVALFPKPWSRGELPHAAVPGASFAVLAVAAWIAARDGPAVRVWEVFAYLIMMAAIYSAMVALAVRAPRLKDRTDRAACVVVSVALLAYAGIVSAGGAFVAPSTSALATSNLAVGAWSATIALFFIALLWLVAIERGFDARRGRDLSLLFAAMPLIRRRMPRRLCACSWGEIGRFVCRR